MFCNKCGTKSIEGSAFCQKCGAKLIVGDAPQQASAPMSSNSIQSQALNPQTDKPKKKKSKKLPIIFGAVALVIVAIIIAASLGDKTDYIMTVKAHTPFVSQGYSYTYGTVLNGYIDSPIWEVSKANDKIYVNVRGETKDTGDSILISILVAVDANDRAVITPASVAIGSDRIGGEDNVVRFLLDLFIAHDGGRSGTSPKSGDTSYTTYTSAEHGFSFKYPSDWIDGGAQSVTEIIGVYDGYGASLSVAEVYILPFELGTGDETLIEAAINDNGVLPYKFVSIDDVGINGKVMRELIYTYESAVHGLLYVSNYFYFVEDRDYQIKVELPADTLDNYQSVFETMMNSYTIIGAGGGTGSGTETALRLYLNHINEVRNSEGWDEAYGSMSLAYINDDDIPELIIDWSDAASGGQVLTVSNGELVSVQLSRGGGISYIERQNLFLHNNGHMDYYYDSVYAIQDGEFVRLHFGEEIGTITGNEESPYEVSYTWDGEDVSSTEYQERLNAAFDHAKAVNTWGENSFNAEEIIQIINGLLEYSSTTAANGQSSSAAVTQGSSLDERLFDTWIEQLPDDWPDYLTFVRVFSPDGTGSWWGDGPGQQFTWRVNGDELTMDISDDAGDEWTTVVRYEVIGDSMTLTYDGGLQNVYLRESAASANQSTGNATANQSTGEATANEVLYNGIPVLSFLDNSIYALRDLFDVFGNPTGRVVDSVMETYHNEVAMWGEFLGSREVTIMDLSALTVNGVSLDKDRNELINILGFPIYEGTHEIAGGEERWVLRYNDMTFYFLTPVNKAYMFAIKAKV